MREDQTNCPNCGGVLPPRGGKCSYCGTYVRRRDAVEILADGGRLTADFVITNEKGEEYIIPFAGVVEVIKMIDDRVNIEGPGGVVLSTVRTNTNVEMVLKGSLSSPIDF